MRISITTAKHEYRFEFKLSFKRLLSRSAAEKLLRQARWEAKERTFNATYGEAKQIIQAAMEGGF